MAEAYTRYAVVTGANKGIGLGTVHQLASHGITVILTARNEQRGLEALRKIKQLELKGEVIFHQLDVADKDSVNHFSDFIKNTVGRLDILVNNAGVLSGKPLDVNKFRDALKNYKSETNNWKEAFDENSEVMEECFNINYYGIKRMCQAMIPFLRQSDFPTIVNVSSFGGMLQYVIEERAKRVLSNIEELSEDKVDELLRDCLQSSRMGGPIWCRGMNGYGISKAAVNAYTRILSKEYPCIRINAVCPGYVVTDITCNSGVLSVEEGAESIVYLALSCNSSSGKFFCRKEESSF